MIAGQVSLIGLTMQQNKTQKFQKLSEKVLFNCFYYFLAFLGEIAGEDKDADLEKLLIFRFVICVHR